MNAREGKIKLNKIMRTERMLEWLRFPGFIAVLGV